MAIMFVSTIYESAVAVCGECCSMTGIPRMHQFVCAILRNLLCYGMADFTSPYYQAVAVYSECCSMTGIQCIHQLSICLYLLACLILPYYLAIAVGGGCCSMTGIHRMQYNTWEHD